MSAAKWHDVSRKLADSDFGGGACRDAFALWLGELDEHGHPIGKGYFVIRSRVLTNAPDDDEECAADGFVLREANCMGLDDGDGYEYNNQIRLFDSQEEAKVFAEGHSAATLLLSSTSVTKSLVNDEIRPAKNGAVGALEDCVRCLHAASFTDKRGIIVANIQQANADANSAALHLVRLQGGIHALLHAPLGESSDQPGAKQ